MLVRPAYLKSFSEVIISKPGDESVTNSATLQDDDDLQFSIGAGETWEARWRIYMTCLATNGAKCAIVVPSGGRSLVFYRILVDVNSFEAQPSSEGGSVNLSGDGADAFGFIEIDALVVNGSTAGTVKLRWAQVSADATATVFKKDSYLVARKK